MFALFVPKSKNSGSSVTGVTDSEATLSTRLVIDSEDQALQAVLGREDFSGIDNEALDFTDLEDYLNNDSDKTGSYFQNELVGSDLKICEYPTKSQKTVAALNANFTRLASNHCPNGNQTIQPLIIGSLPSREINSIPRLNHSVYKANQNINVNLPDSPPDSGSEPALSPVHTDNSLNGNEGNPQITTMMQASGDMKYMGYSNTQPLKHLSETSLTMTPPLQMPTQAVQASIPQHSNVSQTLSAVPSQSASVGSMLSHLQHPITNTLASGLGLQQQPLGPHTPHLTSLYDSNDDFLCDSLDSSSNSHKKRKLTENHKNVVNSNLLNGMMNVKQEAGGISPEPHTNTPVLSTTDDEYSFDFSGPDGSGMFLDSAYQCIRFQPFQQNTWAILCDHTLKELPPPNFRVDADKGFNFSNADDAFVCQKKNHFQVTVHVQPVGEPRYVKTPEGVKKIDHFFLNFNGAKVESPNQTIKVEQSQSDRSKRPFHPVRLDLVPDQVSKTTVGRLHFSETTSNNMRKKGKPNPDQRYFYLVVSLCVASGDLNYTIVAHASERIIVRASNPGQFENDMELSWQRGQSADSIYHAGRVGINTDRPDEALVIHGNLKVTGHIVQPSDARAKTNVQEVDTKEQLKNVANMRIVRYEYRPEFAKHIGLGEENRTSTGVIAQEVQTLIPEAVQEAGDIVLPDGQHIQNFLVVNKERIFMENIGAVKELCKVTDNLGTRIDELEKVNKKLASQRLKRLDSLKSTSSGSTVTSHGGSLKSSKKFSHHHYQYRSAPSKRLCGKEQFFCNRFYFQILVVILIFIMAFCVVAMASLYFFEWSNRQVPNNPVIIRERTFFNVTNVKEISPQPFLELEKSKSSIENSIAVQDNRKETRILDINRTVPNRRIDIGKYTTPYPGISSLMTSRYYQNRYPTFVPILKPRVIGTPNHCRFPQRQNIHCDVHCCSLTESLQASNLDNSDELSYPIIPKLESALHLYDFNEPELNEDSPVEKDVYDSRLDMNSSPSPTEADYSNKQASSTPQPLPSKNDHPVHQNQIRQTRDPINSQRMKLISEKNATDESNSAEVGKIGLPNQLDQKLKNILKNDKVLLAAVEAEKRIRRGTKPFSRKDLPKAIESLRLLEINTTLGHGYCNTLQCAHRTGPRFSYLIPVSKYMVEEYITLQFNLAVPLIVDHCQPDDKPVACPVPQSGAGDLPHDYIRDQNLTEEVDPSWRLPVGLYLRSTYRFRVQTRTVVSDTPCSLPATELGYSFIEFILVFQRTCDK
ncbi:Myelin regulatory factor like protein [Argiope bruennichi]|uniref:Myelin regulatory factor like protein n=1 Tax=Argiope bruennichi TaxID=94029 RepID=A0A8T0EH21_ARGBR|nr:Myelin regulatory factor like protein [Argiope bruennichi]